VITLDETTFHTFGQLGIALYRGRLVAITLRGGPYADDFTTLHPCDTISSKNASVTCRNKELHKLCARK
jgi:hypothetical protein